ncbi:MAG TPA: type IV pilus secretin PilQ [Steroidobacteraceae bacterium]|jgi:type IV pilus assembly protein PilQ|nr:type IV pilus secretin PilQ [Steroidobacteraceae bacterium]
MKRSILHTLRGRNTWLALACAAGMLVALSARAADSAPAAAAANTLQTIDVQTLSGNQLQLTLHLSGPAPEPLSFTIDKPARISLDLPNTTLALPSRRIDVGSVGVDTVLAAEANGRTRIVLNLDQQMPYQTRVSGNDIVVLVGAATDAHAASRNSGGAAPHVAAASGAGSGRAIKSIDFRRSETGGGRLIVRLSDPRTPIDLKQQGSQILVDFAGTDLPKNLTRRYDTMDFGTPVTGFDAERVNNDARIVIDASGNFEQLAYQSDDQYVVEVSPVRKVAAANPADQKKEYKGERLTLNFQDIETRAVLQLLADASGQNIVVSDSVQGSVTLRLQNVPWDQALDIVLRTKGLDKRQEGNVIIVAPADELAAREKADLSAKKDIQALEPVRSEYLQVNYAKAADIAVLLKGSSSGSSTNSVLSARGNVSVDDRTNTLLLQDTADRLADVRRLVTTLDIPVKQVLIESRIVIVTNDFERDLGARFGVTATRANGTNGLYETTGTAAGTDTGISSALSNLTTNGTVYPVSIPTGATAANRYNVNLPVATPAGSIALGILGSDFLVDLELSAAQVENRGTVVASPRVITANQKEASIEQGVEIPYQQSASSGATTIAFKKAVLSLKVKPLITPDNRIILDLTVSDDSVGQVVVASGGVNVPSINTRTIETQVVLGDGQTVVLGGILETTQSLQSTSVPWLGEIPVLGNLFKQTTRVNDKDELLIFITPKILREGVSVN